MTTTDRIAALDASLAPYLGEDWHARARAERAAEIARFETLRRDLLAVLRDAGVSRIVLDYEGGNDNGCIAGRRIEPDAAEAAIAARTVATPSLVGDADAQGWTTVLKETPLLGAVEDLLIHELGRSVGNWYDGDIETSGEIVWTIGPDSDAITGEHSTVLRSSETEHWSADPGDDDGAIKAADPAPAHPAAGALAMAHPLHHAESSVRRFGGQVSDYIAIHQWFDATKSHYSGFSHRALRHHSLGIFEAEARFGVDIVNSDGRRVPVRFIGEQHVKEDCGGRIPSVQDWLGRIEPARWMAAGHMDDGPGEAAPIDRDRWRAAVAAGETILGFADWLAYGGRDAPVRPVLECSTGHLSEATRAWLADSRTAGAVSNLLEGLHGWLVPVIADALDAAPRDLVDTLQHARACGCAYVLFDSDGPSLDARPWRDGASGEHAP